MKNICPKCGAIAEYNAYYGRVTCTRCTWESEKRTPNRATMMYRRASIKQTAAHKMVKA